VMVTDPRGVIQFVNPAFTSITGYAAEEALDKNPNILRSDRHDDGFYKELWGRLIGEGKWRGEIWNRKKNGEPYLQRTTIAAIRDENEKLTHYSAVFSDITKARLDEMKIEHQAYHDTLTGLPNRQLFLDRLTQAAQRAKRNNSKFAVLFIDLDDFKRVNDSFGHVAGDGLLVEIARRLGACARGEDTVARLGGDEFTMIMEKIHDHNEPAKVAQRVIDSVTTPFPWSGENIYATVSIGVAMFPEDGATADDLLKNADLAMYNVKDVGKNKYLFFTREMNEKLTRRIEMEQRLCRAVTNREFIVYYQPKVKAGSREFTGVEALVRWRKDEDAILSPAEFIPLAEETGLIVPIGEQVFREACAQVKKWRDQGYPRLTLAVNVSAKQFDHEGFPGMVRSALDSSGLDPKTLILEMTESVMMRNINTALASVEELKKIGIMVSLDDFGAGYSSLSFLQCFPIDEIKIDSRFVNSIPGNAQDSAIARSIVSLANNLNLRVVVEGVKNESQLRFFQSLQCDELQGFLFSPPAAAGEIEALLREGLDRKR